MSANSVSPDLQSIAGALYASRTVHTPELFEAAVRAMLTKEMLRPADEAEFRGQMAAFVANPASIRIKVAGDEQHPTEGQLTLAYQRVPETGREYIRWDSIALPGRSDFIVINRYNAVVPILPVDPPKPVFPLGRAAMAGALAGFGVFISSILVAGVLWALPMGMTLLSVGICLVASVTGWLLYAIGTGAGVFALGKSSRVAAILSAALGVGLMVWGAVGTVMYSIITVQMMQQEGGFSLERLLELMGQ
jgi:hypothetical protein